MCKNKITNKVWFPCFHNYCRTCFESINSAQTQTDVWKCHICCLEFSTKSVHVFNESSLSEDIWYSGLKKATVSELLYRLNCAFPRSGHEKIWIDELTDDENKILRPYGSAFYRSGDRIQFGIQLHVVDTITKYTVRMDYCWTPSYHWVLKQDFSYPKLLEDKSAQGRRIVSYDCNDPKIIIQSKHNFPLLILPYIPDESIYQLKLKILYYWYLDYSPKCLQLNTDTIKVNSTIIAWIGSK
jgi:hypothetical protein